MKCQTCKRAMVELFMSTRCDWCDFGPKIDDVHRGFAVLATSAGYLPGNNYVFRTMLDAERWRTAAGAERCEIKTVYSLECFRWHLSHGVVRDVVYADQPFEIFPDHRYEPLPHRAFIAPSQEL